LPGTVTTTTTTTTLYFHAAERNDDDDAPSGSSLSRLPNRSSRRITAEEFQGLLSEAAIGTDEEVQSECHTLFVEGFEQWSLISCSSSPLAEARAREEQQGAEHAATAATRPPVLLLRRTSGGKITPENVPAWIRLALP
jgi:hypothetical protein